MGALTAFDVAVIGFGPVGAIAAALLGQAGIRVLAIDKSRTLYDKPRAIALDHEIMRVLQGLGLAKQVVPLTAPFTLSNHFGADGQLVRQVGMLPPPYPMGWTPSMAFLQPKLEQVVRDAVGEMESVDVRLGIELVGLVQDAECVALTLRDEADDEQSVTARYVIGCDGASSTVRSLADLELEDLGFDEPWLVIDLLANEQGRRKLPKVSTHFWDPKRPALFVVGTGNHRRFEMMLLPGENPGEMEREERVWALLAPWIAREDAELWRRASYRFHALVAPQWRRNRVFLAGDAAHQQPPFLGQGMCQGIRDVFNLSWKLCMVLAGTADDALLDTYAVERIEHVRTLIATLKQIGRVVCELDPKAARERDARLRAEYGGEVKTLVRQELLPPLRSGLLTAALEGPRGMLFPQPQLIVDGRNVLLDDAVGGGWRVVLGDEAADWQPRTPLPIKTVRITTALRPGTWQEADRVVADWLQRTGCRAAIVRPDHYVLAGLNTSEELDRELALIPRRLKSSRAVEA